jgi:hypothetical protein
MSLLGELFARVKFAPRDAEAIFDRDEPVGRPTDLVMPRRRWFGRRTETKGQHRDGISGGQRSSAAR